MRGLPIQPLLDDLEAEGTEIAARAHGVLRNQQQHLDEAAALIAEIHEEIGNDAVWVMVAGLRERIAAYLGEDAR